MGQFTQADRLSPDCKPVDFRRRAVLQFKRERKNVAVRYLLKNNEGTDFQFLCRDIEKVCIVRKIRRL